jgi:hypothetical protein
MPPAAAALPHDVLVRICSFVPPGDAIVTVPRLSKALAASPAPCVAGVRAQLATALPEMPDAWLELFSIPLWALQEAWPRLTDRQRNRAALHAALHGDLAALRWAAPRVPVVATTGCLCRAAARGGQLAVLQWARAQQPPCRWDEETCQEAAGGGHLDVLQWARAQQPPCPWGKGTCRAAAKSGHLAVLQWARAQQPPCPWDEETCRAAARDGHLAVLQWARAQQPPCPWV